MINLFLKFTFLILIIATQFFNVFAQNIENSDYTSAIEIFDTITFQYDVCKGYGRKREFLINEKIREENSAWFWFKVSNDTLLTFDIVPIDNKSDYDFIIFKANSVLTIDSIVKRSKMPDRICYSQNKTKYSSTGMSKYSTKTSISHGPGTGYVSPIRVKKDEIYYIMVNYEDEYNILYPNRKDKGFRIYFYESWEIKRPIELKTIIFETGKSELLKDSYDELDQLVLYLIENKNISIEIKGYTDNVGNNANNQKLSKSRADSVAQYLSQKGINPNRLITYGHGSSYQIGDNSTEKGRKGNRRVEFSIILK